MSNSPGSSADSTFARRTAWAYWVVFAIFISAGVITVTANPSAQAALAAPAGLSVRLGGAA